MKSEMNFTDASLINMLQLIHLCMSFLFDGQIMGAAASKAKKEHTVI